MKSFSAAVDRFRLAFDRFGSPGSPAVVLLHGWPGTRHDYRAVVPQLVDVADVVVPDLRGFGESDKHMVDASEFYGALGQAHSVAALVDELGFERVVIGGYDIGSRIAQVVAGQRPQRVAALVLSPPLPGVGQRVLGEEAQQEFWYQSFHQLPLADELIDGKPDAVRAYLRHFWIHWSGPNFTLSDRDMDQLVAHYRNPGAFIASIGWYRAGAGTVAHSLAERSPRRGPLITTPTKILWGEHDPLFPPEWADRLGEYFADVTVHFSRETGHFTPLECADQFAELIRHCLVYM
jgi:pimeloyl-ACP methyl ester carboxylesterase